MAVTGSYSGDPTSTTRDRVRFLLGDVRAPFLLSDQEIDYLLGRHGGPLSSAAAGADSIAAQFATQVNKTIGKLNVSASQRMEHYQKLASRLRQRMLAEGEIDVFVGGLSKDDKRNFNQDPDLVQPSTQIGADDYPGTETDVNPNLWWWSRP